VRTESVAAIGGSTLVAIALIVLWSARLTVSRDLYVSELGAEGQPTARAFQVALILISIGGSAIAWSARAVRSRVAFFALWTPAVSIWVASGFFFLASQITCTSGCPLPVGETFTWQDFTHTTLAVLAFAAACWAMLQTAFARDHALLRVLSLTAGIAVIVLASAGGILSLARFEANFGSRLELAATTVALVWLLAIGVVLAREHSRVTARQPR
jgi:Protein of unknown function (DUF998)